MTVSALPRPTTLAEWIAATIPPRIAAMDAAPVESLRFLFYGRASTREHQDPRTSRAWQLDIARKLTREHGTIVGEYFEVGCSRQCPGICGLGPRQCCATSRPTPTRSTR
ncbi:hypothetical protein GCM10010492_70300 [Saccharothrix mutabilis subsp. mutabilis]|uniref:Resolvase/invertase-type recombinase catalytic domain-containing protein n=1 Tax=Saccharothrix mutabilis subsp. mutabilis TaxID=66855 RepID=A0ABP3ED79_9PSEU